MVRLLSISVSVTMLEILADITYVTVKIIKSNIAYSLSKENLFCLKAEMSSVTYMYRVVVFPVRETSAASQLRVKFMSLMLHL